MTRRLAIVGMGKMGRAIADLAPSHGFEVAARLDHAEMESGFTKDMLAGADVAVEFTVPEAAPANVRALVAAGCPVVVGTTGWYAHLDDVRGDVNRSNGALLAATNFSLGVNIFEQVLARAAELFAAAPGFDAHMIETHHAAKKDAPSGTALTLAKAAAAAGGREIPITSVRVGSVPGIHEVIFDAQFEQVRLQHVARDRRVFAEGALVAAAWLIGRRGVFTMKDVLDSSSHA
ncbi:MAG TPA: dihydrodipicolinate reductase C-terminal domain-containing protein [Gemmatimonadaceae bacterium]|jgi:4-hydroxy-tetrahydrodipicolinate reductase|nr:dihydrodipicolinate reductase C-terminal domain-containing protein [Gemmatimonadaceae bacterium]